MIYFYSPKKDSNENEIYGSLENGLWWKDKQVFLKI